MIAILTTRRRRLTAEHQRQFTAMLPAITRAADHAFRDLDPEGREEAVAEVVAAAFVMFVGLVRDGRGELAYPSVLAMYAIKRVRIGRKAATKLNVRDVGSEYCQLAKGISVERIDRYDRDTETWQEALVEDRRAGPAETAAARIDFGEWFHSLTSRDRKIASFLAAGNTTTEASRRFALSAGRISQKRREFMLSWQAFQGENPARPHTAWGPA
jgi:hypothetical protein